MTQCTTTSFYYFDANALWKYYRDQKGSLTTRRLVAVSQYPILVSPLSILEFVGVLMRYYRRGYIKRGAINKVIARLRRDTGSCSLTRPFLATAIPAKSFSLAQGYLLQHADQFSIGCNDSLHMAIVSQIKQQHPGTVMVTADNSLLIVCGKAKIDCYNPEIDTL